MARVLDKNGEELHVGDRVRRGLIPGRPNVEEYPTGRVVLVDDREVEAEFVEGNPVPFRVSLDAASPNPYRCPDLELIHGEKG